MNYVDFAECAREDSHDSRLKENLGGLELPTSSETGRAPQKLSYKPLFSILRTFLGFVRHPAVIAELLTYLNDYR